MTTTVLDDETHSGEEAEDGVERFGASRAYGVLLVVCGALGILAAWMISLDELVLAANPNAQLGCSFNPIISCGNIMKSAQAHIFGFPNPMIGMVCYPVEIAVGMAVIARTRFRRWYWLGLQTGTLLGTVFVTWLQYESFYSIGSLCPWCMLAWVATITAFLYTLAHNVRSGMLKVPAVVRGVLLEFPWAILTVWFGIIAILILVRWWTYWSTLI